MTNHPPGLRPRLAARVRRRLVPAVLGLSLGVGPAWAAEPAPADLAETLRQGGHVIYFRHAATETDGKGHGHGGDLDLSDCATQRNLSAKGRDQAREIGRAFDVLAIPVGDVRTSPYCRCEDTARLAFTRASLDDNLISTGHAETPEEKEEMIKALRRALSTAPDEGTNTVLVSHSWNIRFAAELDLQEGEAAVFRPVDGDPGFELVARLMPADWRALASEAAAAE